MTTTAPITFKPAAHNATPTPVARDRAARWSADAVLELMSRPFLDLLFDAQRVHREHFTAGEVQCSTLLSIKTGGCSEDCGYCSQSARYDTGLEREQLLSLDEVLAHARAAKDRGASRFCMGAAWRGPKDRDLEAVTEMVREVKALGLETCVTLGMLKEGQAETLAEAGLDYYNHNLDTDAANYASVITTHTQQDRLDTLSQVRAAGIHVCSGGILGMGEDRAGRAALLAQLASLPVPPESVPINNLVAIPGTPLAEADPLDPFELVRTIATARIIMPTSRVRLSAGRDAMDDALQALCFAAGANSIFAGQRLLTTPNPGDDRDTALFARLDLTAV